MSPRVKVRPMPGSNPSILTGFVYWRWRCPACTNLGHWTTADFAHDDGRAHAKECAALKYAWLVEKVKGSPLEHVCDRDCAPDANA